MTKFYAVRVGRNPGIYNSWDAAKREVTGFSGAEYKSFKSKEAAQNFIDQLKKEAPIDGLVAYVDGSYDKRTQRAGFGAVILVEGKVIHEMSQETKIDLDDNLWNVSAEIAGVLYAVTYGISHQYNKIHIHYDYQGLEKWAIGEWRANKQTTKNYQEKMTQLMKEIKVYFVKVKAHTGDYYNERADDLAKQSIFGG